MDKKSVKKQTPKPLEIDYRKLENDLESQIREDELYWLRNDAKLRAVTQGTPTYEDFRQIVLAANLKPISKEEKEEMTKKSAAGQVIWNTMAGGEKCDRGRTGDRLDNCLLASNKLTSTQTTSDFIKTWKGLSDSRERLEYLRYLAKDCKGDSRCTLERLCHQEFPMEIFPEFVHSIHEEMVGRNGSVSVELTGEVIWILCVVSECTRFKLGLSFLDEKSKTRIVHILNLLEEIVTGHAGENKKSVRELFDVVKHRYGNS